MSYQYIETETTAGVLTIRFNRPDALNALIPPMLEEVVDAFDRGPADASVIVVEGAGRAFCAGVDLKLLSGVEVKAGRVGTKFDELAHGVMRTVRASSRPVIAKVHGACFTGALEFALHCDFIHTTVDTKFGDTHAKFAIRPSWGMSQTLVQAVGLRRAKELSYTAKTFFGSDAVAWGLANAAHADKAALDAAVADVAAAIVANDGATVAAYKDLHRIAETHDVPAGIQAEVDADFPAITDSLKRIGGFTK